MTCPNCDEPDMYTDYRGDTGITRYVCDHCHFEETR